MRNLLTFSTKKSHISWYLKSSLLISLYRFMYQDARRLLMSDLFVEKVSRFLMSRHLMSSHLKKEMRWLLMRCQLTTTWTGLTSFFATDFKNVVLSPLILLFKVSHHVDHTGKIFMTYLTSWNYPESNLLGLIQACRDAFGELPPVFSKVSSQTQVHIFCVDFRELFHF